jgi:hypothetical protein
MLLQISNGTPARLFFTCHTVPLAFMSVREPTALVAPLVATIGLKPQCRQGIALCETQFTGSAAGLERIVVNQPLCGSVRWSGR